MSTSETIAAISTPIGPGGIGIVRISGPGAVDIAVNLIGPTGCQLRSQPSHSTALRKVINPGTGETVDEALVTVMRAPASYTREDVVEINCHSGAPTLRAILNLVLEQGARIAEPGEFTKRAFLSGRIDLTQAQAVISLIQAQGDAAARAAASQAEGRVAALIAGLKHRLLVVVAELEAAIDFSDEDLDGLDPDGVRAQVFSAGQEISRLIERADQGQILDRGLTVAIVGRPNVGKSSLLNALAQEDKAIVSTLPGTTRDVVESKIMLGEIPLNIKDTAGWRSPGDEIEAQGIGKARQARNRADLVILVLDGSEPLQAEDNELILELKSDQPLVTVVNKVDLAPALAAHQLPQPLPSHPIVSISAKTGRGLDELSETIAARVGILPCAAGDEAVMASSRQKRDLAAAKMKLDEALAAERDAYGEEVISSLVKEAIGHLSRFSGEDVDDEVLAEIFSRFCIGK